MCAREDNAQLTSIAIGARGSPLLKCHELLALGICPHEHNYIRASAMNGFLAENAPAARFRTSLGSVCQPSLLQVAKYCILRYVLRSRHIRAHQIFTYSGFSLLWAILSGRSIYCTNSCLISIAPLEKWTTRIQLF